MCRVNHADTDDSTQIIAPSFRSTSDSSCMTVIIHVRLYAMNQRLWMMKYQNIKQ